MDWEEIKKGLWVYIATWPHTDIFWPLQDVLPTDDSWIELHVLDHDEDYVRKTGKESGELYLQLGIFSKSRNQYIIDTIQRKLSDFLAQKDLTTTNYQLRSQELQGTDVPWKGSERIQDIAQHRACTVVVKVWET